MANVPGIMGAVFSFVFIIAPVETMIRIKRENGVGDRTVYNYVGTWANAVAWVGYAAPRHGRFVAGTNIAAMCAEFVYTWFYFLYAQGRARRIAAWAIVVEVLWAVLLLGVYFAFFPGGRNHEIRDVFFGTLAAVTAVIMYLAMIPDTLAVIRMHDVRQQGILLLLAGVGNTSSWIAFGNKPRDLFVLVPNCIGVGLTGLMTFLWVILCVYYRNAVPQQDPQANVQLQNQQQNAPQNQPANVELQDVLA